MWPNTSGVSACMYAKFLHILANYEYHYRKSSCCLQFVLYDVKFKYLSQLEDYKTVFWTVPFSGYKICEIRKDPLTKKKRRKYNVNG